MSKQQAQAKPATQAKPTIAKVDWKAQGAAIAEAYGAGDLDIAAAQTAVASAQASQVQKLVAACAGLPAIDHDKWKETDGLASSVKAALVASGRYAEKSINPTLSKIGVAVMAITHGILPTEGQKLYDFTKEASETLKAKGVYKPREGGRPSQPKAAKDTSDAEKRLAAAMVLFRNNKAKAQRLALAAQYHPNELDAFCAKIISETERTGLPPSEEAPAPVTPAPAAAPTLDDFKAMMMTFMAQATQGNA